MKPPRKIIEFQTPEALPEFRPDPRILTQPNIPKPLHGVNPRTILGEGWWEIQKGIAKQRTGNRCEACGSGPGGLRGKPWLECHEAYDFDYKNGRVSFLHVSPLCHYCHNFIHSGRLTMIAGKEKTWDEVRAILEHGFQTISAWNKARPAGTKCLQAFPSAKELSYDAKARTFGVRASKLPETSTPWADWRLVIDGKEFPPIFKTFQEWRAHWGV